MTKKAKSAGKEVIGFLGLGLDSKDEMKRITECEGFLLLGGSASTHERMQDTAIRFNEGLKQRRKRLQEATLEEILELFHKSLE